MRKSAGPREGRAAWTGLQAKIRRDGVGEKCGSVMGSEEVRENSMMRSRSSVGRMRRRGDWCWLQ